MTTQADAHRHTPQLIPPRLLRGGQVHHPAVLGEPRRRSASVQLRLADRTPAFAGSKNFVWLHAALFGVWMLFLEQNPWPTLTLKTDLELTRQIHLLTEELHKRIIGKPGSEG